ncbi:valine-tRNA ligase [Ceratobasidium sp. AG-Ba]|nr:valine-tRNA ligase [Ceratobasidium sp. AG-Ba]
MCLPYNLNVHAISDAGSLVPVWPLRAHFLRSLKFKDNRPPSMSVNRVVSMKTLLYVCSRKLPALKESALHELVVHRGSQGVEDMQVDAPPNLQEAQKVYHSTGTNKRQLIVARSRMRLPNLFTETLPDLHRQRDDDDDDDDDEERPRGTPLSQLVTDVLCDLPTQIFEKALVAKAGHSWCTITRGLADVTPDAFLSGPCRLSPLLSLSSGCVRLLCGSSCLFGGLSVVYTYESGGGRDKAN